MSYSVDETRCDGCGVCSELCPSAAIPYTIPVASIDEGLCTECGVCARACPQEAVLWDGQRCRPLAPPQDAKEGENQGC